MGRFPDSFTDLVDGTGLSRPLGQQAEQLEFNGCQIDPLASDPHLVAFALDRDFAVLVTVVVDL